MTATPRRSPWDFTDALQLLKDETPRKSSPYTSSHVRLETTPSKRPSRLGDFSSIWRDLGAQPHVLSSDSVDVNDYALPNPNHPPAQPLRGEDTYASDGGFTQTKKSVTFKDELDYAGTTTDVPTTPTSEDGPISSRSIQRFNTEDETATDLDAAALEKKQRKRLKKQRQKEKKRLAQLEEVTTPTRKVFSDVDSEAEIKRLPRVTPASKASKHLVVPAVIPASGSPVQILKRPIVQQSQSTATAEDLSKGEDSDRKQRFSHHRGSSADIPGTPTKSRGFTRAAINSNLLPTSVPQVARASPAQELSRTLQSQFAGSVPAHIPITMAPTKKTATQVSPFSTVRPRHLSQVIPPRLAKNNRAGHRPANPLAQYMSCIKADVKWRALNHFDGLWWQLDFTEDHSGTAISAPSADVLSNHSSQQNPNPHHSTVVALPSRIAHSSHSPNSLAHDSALLTVKIKVESLTPSLSNFQVLEREDRDLQLLLRLVHEFSEDKKWLTKPVPMANHNSSPEGVHVFVDFSNIWIGFMDHLKTLQGHIHQRIPHQNISFGALVLLLERRRPVAKRVLAGSYPLMPAMELAKEIGYETLILEKVYKSREPSEKQRRILAMQSRNSFAALGTQGSPTPNGLSTSPSKSAAAFTNQPPNSFQPTPAPEKWVEQGVDEILHLKILESIVDSEIPSTMVVATGDAAKAEYSEGFMKMIVRALKKGWMVELVAFSKSISGEYWKRGFQAEWEGRFKILVLDTWAQFLLDT